MRDSRKSIEKLRRDIAARFSDEAAVVDARLRDDFYDEDAHESWIEKFCDTTNAAMALRDEPLVRDHFSFMSQQLANADDSVRQAIDVSYAENLMWNLDSEAKRWAWPFVPANLKQLYVDMWGEPTF